MDPDKLCGQCIPYLLKDSLWPAVKGCSLCHHQSTGTMIQQKIHLISKAVLICILTIIAFMSQLRTAILIFPNVKSHWEVSFILQSCALYVNHMAVHFWFQCLNIASRRQHNFYAQNNRHSTVLQVYAAVYILFSWSLSEIQAVEWGQWGCLTKEQDPTTAEWANQGKKKASSIYLQCLPRVAFMNMVLCRRMTLRRSSWDFRELCSCRRWIRSTTRVV